MYGKGGGTRNAGPTHIPMCFLFQDALSCCLFLVLSRWDPSSTEGWRKLYGFEASSDTAD